MAKVVLKLTLAIQASHVGAVATHLSQPQKMSVVARGQAASTSAMGAQDLQQGSLAARGRS